jgi:hypothetical protein
MRSMRTALLILIAMTSVAAADGYACPQVDGLQQCPSDRMVPEGCPLHVLLGHGFEPAAVQTTVMRGAQVVDVTGTVTTTPITHGVGTKDYYSCDCDEITVSRMFDIYSVSLVGVVAGETVEWAAGTEYGGTTIGPAGPCPAFTYSTNFYEPIACDLCPEPPPGGDDAGPFGGGCEVGGSGSLAVVLGAVLALRRRRRYG